MSLLHDDNFDDAMISKAQQELSKAADSAGKWGIALQIIDIVLTLMIILSGGILATKDMSPQVVQILGIIVVSAKTVLSTFKIPEKSAGYLNLKMKATLSVRTLGEYQVQLYDYSRACARAKLRTNPRHLSHSLHLNSNRRLTLP